MKKTHFEISTSEGRKTVEGWKTDDLSMIGIHRVTGDPLFTVTLIPVGSKIDSIFPEQLRKPACRALLLDFIGRFEEAALPALLACSVLPFGTESVPPELEDVAAYIRKVAATL